MEVGVAVGAGDGGGEFGVEENGGRRIGGENSAYRWPGLDLMSCGIWPVEESVPPIQRMDRGRRCRSYKCRNGREAGS